MTENQEREERRIRRANKIFKRNLATTLDKILGLGFVASIVYGGTAELYEKAHDFPAGSHVPLMVATAVVYFTYRLREYINRNED